MAEIRTETATVVSLGVPIPVYLAMPQGIGPYGIVVVLQEIFGVNAHIRDVARRLAQVGYLAMAPALYHRQAPGFETGYTPEDITAGRRYKVNTRSNELLSDIQATIAYGHTLPQAQPGGVGCIGFCFGGHVAYLAATLPETVAVASFYGAGIPDTAFGPGPVALERTADITGTLYAFFGQQDASIPPEAVAKVREALEQHQIEHQVFEYPEAGHGFFCDRRASYSAAAAADAWQQAMNLFSQQLGT